MDLLTSHRFYFISKTTAKADTLHVINYPPPDLGIDTLQ